MESRLHKAISVIHPKTKELVEIDEELVAIILLLWKKGYDTMKSCQEVPEGYAWIQFADNKENVANFSYFMESCFDLDNFQFQDNHVHFKREIIPKLTTSLIQKDDGTTKEISTRLYIDKCYRDMEFLRREEESRRLEIEHRALLGMEWMFWNLMHTLESGDGIEVPLLNYKLLDDKYRTMHMELREKTAEEKLELQKWVTEETRKRKEKHEPWREAAAAGLPYFEWNKN